VSPWKAAGQAPPFFLGGVLGFITRGAGKNKSTDPPVHLLNLRPTHPPPDFFFSWHFFLVRFWAFLGKGSSKTPQKYLYKRTMSKKKIKNFDKNFDVSFSSTFF
jgi:hypothetical protein